MKLKQLATAALAFSITVSGMTAFADSSDLTDAGYYTSLFTDDFQSREASDAPGTTGDNNGIWKGCVKETDGNIYWYGYRAVAQSGGTTNVITSPGITAYPATIIGESAEKLGEYVIQNKIKFDQSADTLDGFNLQTHFEYCGTMPEENKATYAQTTQMGIKFPSLNVKDNEADTIQYYANSVVNGAWAQRYSEDMPGCKLSNGNWYTFRQTYNLNLKTLRFQIFDSTGEQQLYDYTVSMPTQENGKTNYILPYNGQLLCHELFWGQVKFTAGNGYGLDDIKIWKSAKKPVTVTFDSALGEVKLGDTPVTSGTETPVAYGSDATLTILPKGANTIKDVTVDGTSVGSGATVNLSQIYSAKTVEVTFEKGEEQPEGAVGEIDFASKLSTDTTIKTFDTAYANGVTEFKFYDNGVSGGLVVFKSADKNIGEYFKLYEDNLYTFATDQGTPSYGEKTVTKTRSPGWHTVKLKTYTDSYDLYLDGTLIKTVKLNAGTSGIVYLNAESKDTHVIADSSRKLWYGVLETAPLYRVSVTAGEGGTASVDREFVESGETAVLTVSPNENYSASVTVNGSEVPLNGNTLDLSDIKADTAVVVTFTKNAPVIPSVSKTQVIANGEYQGGPSAVIYAKITGTATGAGIILKDAASGNELVLNAKDLNGADLTGGDFGIRVFGKAMVTGNTYQYIPFVTYQNGTDDETVKSEEGAFTFGANN